jgi:hypothetical protein
VTALAKYRSGYDTTSMMAAAEQHYRAAAAELRHAGTADDPASYWQAAAAHAKTGVLAVELAKYAANEWGVDLLGEEL